MITFLVDWREDVKVQATVTLRTSGTEPKIKYYSEISGAFADHLLIDQVLQGLVDAMVRELLEPEKNGLEK